MLTDNDKPRVLIVRMDLSTRTIRWARTVDLDKNPYQVEGLAI